MYIIVCVRVFVSLKVGYMCMCCVCITHDIGHRHICNFVFAYEWQHIASLHPCELKCLYRQFGVFFNQQCGRQGNVLLPSNNWSRLPSYFQSLL